MAMIIVFLLSMMASMYIGALLGALKSTRLQLYAELDRNATPDEIVNRLRYVNEKNSPKNIK